MKIESLEFVSLKMKINKEVLDIKLRDGACKVKFLRKRPVNGKPITRTMWCTKDWEMLNSMRGKVTLNYRPPRGEKHVHESSHNVLIVWDIIMQDYRTINMGECELIREVGGNDEFWKFFEKELAILTSEDKQVLINS